MSQRGIRVLCVDDHDLMRHALMALMEHEQDIEVVGEAASAESALLLTKALLPDVIVIAAELPVTDGIELLGRLTARDPTIRAVILTTFVSVTVARKIFALGGLAYLDKRYARFELVDAVRSASMRQLRISAMLASEIVRVLARPALSATQQNVLEWLVQGFDDNVMATRLNVDECTIRMHVDALIAKLQASSREHAVQIALSRGLADP